MTSRISIALVCISLALSGCEAEKKGDSKSGDEKAAKKKAAKEKAAAQKADESDDEKGADRGEADEITEEAKLAEPTTVEGGKCDAPKKLTGLKANTVLTAESGGCYLVEKVLKLHGGEKRLTIKPGVTIKFGENAGLKIRKAALVAQGTADEPIVLTGGREMPGYWKGVVVRESNRPDNSLEHVAIEYAGNDSTFSGVEPAGLMFDDYHGQSTFEIRQTTISHSQGYGLYLEANTDLDFANNTLTKNKLGAARVAPGALGELDAKSTYEGNENDRITVPGGTLKKQEATWAGIGVPYEVADTITVRKDSFVTVEPGATFEFTENTGLKFRRSRLHAAGESDAKIRFTGAREVAGIWKGIVLRESDSVDNLLEHVVVSYAGGDKFSGTRPAGVMFDDYHGKSTFEIRHSEFSHSAGYGLYVEQNTDLKFAENTLTKNAEGAARIHPAVVGSLDAASTYSGNEKERVHVPGATVKGVEATWAAIDAPYVVEETVHFRKDSFLTLPPGVTVKFAENQGLIFRKSKLKASGSAEEPILLTGVREVAGFWRGLLLRETSSIDNVLEHVTVEYAGASQTFDGVQPAAVMFDNYHGPISVRIGHLAVKNSGAAALHIEKKVKLKSDDCSTVTLEAEPTVTEKSRPFEKVCGS